MKIKIFTFNPFQENTYLIYDETKECVIIDAGCYDKEEEKEISEFITKNELKPKFLINTHCHIDHVLGIRYLKEKYKIEFLCSQKDEFLLNLAKEQGLLFGIKLDMPPLADKYITKSEKIEFGNIKIQILDVPGHTPGHLAFYNSDENCVFTGDVLFKGSIGRTDLPGGNYETLMTSIKNQLMILNDDCVVYAGHGASTTIGFEKMSNPFL